MKYLYLALAIISSGLSGNVYKRLSGKSKSVAMSSLFPSLWFLLLSVAFAVSMIINRIPFDVILKPQLLVPGFIGGVGLALASSILIESMKHNSLSISVILVNLNFIIPVILSTVFLNEEIKWIQIVGMLLSVCVILVLNIRKDENNANRRFAIVLPCIACIANGAVNFCIKIHQNKMGETALNGYYMVMYLTGAIVCILMWVFFCRKTDIKFFEGKLECLKILSDAIMLGACNGVCFYMAGLLAGRMNAAAQFTIITAASVLLSLIVGIVFQKETLSKKNVLSFVFCMIAILCQASGV